MSPDFAAGVGVGAFAVVIIEAVVVALALWLGRRDIERGLWS